MERSVYTLLLLGVTALGASAAVTQSNWSVPATGNSNYGYKPPVGTPVTPNNMGAQGAVPPSGQPIPAAKSVQKTGPNRQPANLLHQADRALTQRKVAVAHELLERAQTGMLNMNSNDRNDNSKVAFGIGSAQHAVVAGNMAEAPQHIADALTMLPAGNEQPAAPQSKRRRHHEAEPVAIIASGSLRRQLLSYRETGA